MSRRTVIAVVISVAFAALFARLGFWQLQRLAERRAFNATLAQRTTAPAVAPAALPADTALSRYRRVRLVGTFDFVREMVLGNRPRDGDPGVRIITPFVPSDGGPVVLVDRGWVYSPDAATVQLERWREPARVALEGFVQQFAAGGPTPARAASSDRLWWRLDGTAVQRTLPYTIAPFYVVALPDSASQAAIAAQQTDAGGMPIPTRPVRLGLPPLSEGSHKSYAIQWFFFSLVALTGAAVAIAQERQRRGPRYTAPPLEASRKGGLDSAHMDA